MGARINIRSRMQLRFADLYEDSYELSDKEQAIVEQIADEQQQVDSAEQELEQICKERERMDEMLKRLRKVLGTTEDTGEEKKDK